MAVSFYNMPYNKIQAENLKNVNKNVDSIYVFDGTGYVKISEFRYSSGNDAELDKNVFKTVSQFEKTLKSGLVRRKNGTTPTLTNEFYTSIELPPTKVYVSNDINVNGEKAIPFGLKRALEFETYTGSDYKKSYIYLKIRGKSEWQFVPFNEVGYFKGTSFKTFGTDKELQTALQNGQDIFLTSKYNNATVEEIYVGDYYVFTKVAQSADGKPLVEEIDAEKGTRTNLQAGKNGSLQLTSSQIGNLVFSTYVKSAGKGAEASVQTRSYHVNTSNNGRFVRLRLSGDTKDIMVPVESLRKLGSDNKPVLDKEVKFAELKNLIGSEIAVAYADNSFALTAPLTAEQALISYDLPLVFQRTYSDSSVLNENSYLAVKDGSYQKESEVVKPISYQFVKSAETDFDVYIVTVNPGTEEEQEIVVDKNTFKKSNEVLINYGEQRVTVQQKYAVKAKRCALSFADAIQTTSQGNRAEQCKLLSNKHNFKAISGLNKEQVVKDLLNEFLQKYKNGEYELDGYINVDDELMELAKSKPEQCRYLLQEFISEPDHASKLNEYAYFASTPLRWDGEKLIGGPKYNAKDGLKKDFKGIGVASVYIILASLSWGGILAAAISPWIVGSAFIGLAGYSAFRLIYQAVKNWQVEHNPLSKKHHFKHKNKVEIQRKHLKKEIFAELKQYVSDTENLDTLQQLLKNVDGEKITEAEKIIKKQEISAEYKAKLVAQFALLEQRAETLGATITGAEFKMVNGDGVVDENNAFLFCKYRDEMSTLQRRINQLQKKQKKGKITDEEQRELDLKSAEFKAKQKNYKINEDEIPADKDYDKVMKAIAKVKGIMLTKYFEEVKVSETETLTKEEVEFIKNSKLDINARKQKLKLKASRHSKDKNLWENQEFVKKIVSLGETQSKALAPTSFIKGAKKRKKPLASASPVKTKGTATAELEEGVATSRRSVASMSDVEVEKIIRKVTSSMSELSKISHAYFTEGDLIGGEEEKAEDLKQIFEENKDVLKAVLRKGSKWNKRFGLRYANDILTANKQYKEYLSAIENKTVSI